MAGERIMVLGATRFIGPAVLRRILARGGHPIAVSRRGGNGGVAGTEGVRLDRQDRAALARAIRDLLPDAVIDLLAYTASDTLPLFDRLAGQVGRYVMASSGDVYRQYDLLHRRDTATPLARLAEDSPLRRLPYPYRSGTPRDPTAPDAWMDDYDKVPLECALAEQRDLAWSVVRLPMVFGPGDRNRRFAWAIGPMLAGEAVLRIDADWAAWRTSLGYVEDAADALVLAALHPHAERRTFNAGPAWAKSSLEWAQALAAACGWRGVLETTLRERLPEPTRIRLSALDLEVPFVMDTERIRRELGYAEPTAEADALAATIAAERAPVQPTR